MVDMTGIQLNLFVIKNILIDIYRNFYKIDFNSIKIFINHL